MTLNARFAPTFTVVGEEVESSTAVHGLKGFAPEWEFHGVAANQLKVRQAIRLGTLRGIAKHRSRKIEASHMTSRETSSEAPCVNSRTAAKIQQALIALQVGCSGDQRVLTLKRDPQESGKKGAPPPEPTLVHANERWPFHQALG